MIFIRKRRFQKRKEFFYEQKMKKLMSLFLTLAMVLSTIAVPDTTAHAKDYDASGGLNVYFKYTGTEEGVWTQPLLNAWTVTGTTAVDGSALEYAPVEAWKGTNASAPTYPAMAEGEDGWFSAKVTGATLQGIDFVFAASDSQALEAKDIKDFKALAVDATAIYYTYDGTTLKAFSNSGCAETDLLTFDPSINLHFVNAFDWSIVKVNYWGNISSSEAASQTAIEADSNGYYSINIIPSNTSDSGFQFYPNDGTSDVWSKAYKLQNCFPDDVKDLWVVPQGDGEKNFAIFIKPTAFSIEGSSVVAPGKTVDLKLTATPEEPFTGFTDAVWTSSDEEVATVDATGKVTTIKDGEVTITATSKVDETVKAQKTITVQDIKVTEVVLNKTELTMSKGMKTSLTAIVTPENANDTSVTWTSSDEEIVSVVDGIVNALAAGTATIKAQANDGSGKYAECTVTVNDKDTVKVSSITLSGVDNKLIAGETVALATTVLPENSEFTEVKYTSSDESVATVDAEGKVTAVSVGSAVITATTDNMADDSGDGTPVGTITVTVGDTFTLRGEAIGWNTNIDYAFRYVAADKMKIAKKLTLKKGYYSFQGATDGWSKKVGNGKTYEIYVNNETEAEVVIEFTSDPTESAAVIKFTGTNEDDITTEIPEVKEIYTVVGNVKGEAWDWFSNDKLMTANEDGSYEYIWPDIEAGKTYTYQLAKDGATFGYKYQIVNPETSGDFSYTATARGALKITYNPTAESKFSQEFILGVTAVEIKNPPEKITVGEFADLSVEVTPTDAVNKKVTWDSSDKTVATIDENGKVTALKSGTTEITVTSEDGSFTDTCTITVEPKKYTVTFKDGETVAKTEVIEEGKSATAPALTKEGYTLSWDKAFTNIKEDTVVNAIWTEVLPDQFIVKFDKNGGKVSHPQEKFEHSKKLGKLPTSKRAKYTFAGWYTAKRGGELVTSNTVVKNNMTLYAHWKKVKVHKTKVISKRTTKNYIYVNVKKVTGAAGYELKCYRNGRLYKTVQKRSEKLSVVASKKGRYLIRVRAFKKDSMNKKVYGMYSSGINIIK